MTSNINIAYHQHWEDFSLLGKSMNKYAIASWISMAVSFFGTIIMQSIIIIPMMAAMESGTYTNPNSALPVIGGMTWVFYIITFAISIYQFVTYIQYLMQLKKVGEYTRDIDLQKAYKMELWALIFRFILMLVITFAVLFLIIGGGRFLTTITNESELYRFFMLLIGFFFIVFIIALIAIILQVLSSFALDRWGQRIKMANFQNPYAVNIAEGTNFMKIGRIVSIFAGSIGMILFLIGIMKAGKNIIEYFDGYGNSISTQGTAFPQSSSGNTPQLPGPSTTNPNLSSSYMGNSSYGSTTMKPQGEGFCPFCGSKLEDKNSMFCSNCGRKLV